MASRTYLPESVEIEHRSTQSSTWSRPGGKSVSGQEHLYTVTDDNRQSYKTWEFAVRVPKRAGDIEVIPTAHPASQSIASLSKRSVIFVSATRQRFEGFAYCKVNLSDPTGEKNRVGVRFSERDELPAWFGGFPKSIFQRKPTVADTAGTDGDALVCVVRPDDHERMIRLYFAMRVWVLIEAGG